MDTTVTKNVCTKNQCATSTTMEKAQNCLIAPEEKTARTPSRALYATTLSVFDVPARLRPCAIRSFTGKVMDVLTTASTCTDQSVIDERTDLRMGTHNTVHVLDTYEHDNDREQLPGNHCYPEAD